MSVRRAPPIPTGRPAHGRSPRVDAGRPTATPASACEIPAGRPTSCRSCPVRSARLDFSPMRMHVQRQPERRADTALGVERGQRILLHKLDRAAMREVAACRQRAAAEGNLAQRLRVDAEDHVGDRRLAGSGFTDDRQALAFRDSKDTSSTARTWREPEVKILETERSESSGWVISFPPVRRSRHARPAERNNPREASSISGMPPPVMRGTALSSARV